MANAIMHKPHGLPLPGILWGDYPERRADAAASTLAARLDGAWNTLRNWLPASQRRAHRDFARRVGAQAAQIDVGDHDQWQARLRAVRSSLARHGLNESTALEACTLSAAACRHTLGYAPFETQIQASRALLANQLVEMATGEGKTVAVALAAAAAALGGTPVHVITANDYLALRDADALQEFYRICGLAAAAVTQPMDRAARRAAYTADITYCSARELAFDYLRDGLSRPRGLTDLGRRARRLGTPDSAAGGTVLRGLCMAIIDEVDTVLIDEARMPLVLSQAAPQGDAAAFLRSALQLARSLGDGTDFTLLPERRAILTAAGRVKVADWAAAPGPYAGQRRHREDMLCQALAALHLYLRDRDYVVRDGKIDIVDDNTGRAACGRAWSRGLHQLIELKEDCAISQVNQAIAQITYQRLFRRYLRIAGISGTLGGAERELHGLYGSAVTRIAPRTPSRRLHHRLRLYADRGALWPAVVRRAREIHAVGRPLLIGTASVADSEQLSLLLTAAGLPHALLNARQDQTEADLIAHAGDAGAITVATSMAGRGTDIRLGPGVAERGGLHVILCQHNSARRIDRQFSGRAARNGEPGSVDTMLALDMPLFTRRLPAWWHAQAGDTARLPGALIGLTATLPQWLEERHQRAQRRALCRLDDQRERALDFCQRTAS